MTAVVVSPVHQEAVDYAHRMVVRLELTVVDLPPVGPYNRTQHEQLEQLAAWRRRYQASLNRDR